MPDTTTHLGLPYLMAAQAQKHVTHNEALRLLDAIVQLSVLDRTRTAPPASPADGDRHLVASGATGLWAGWDLNVAYWVDGAWIRLVPRPGWLTWVAAESLFLVWTGSAWEVVTDALGIIVRGASVDLARSTSGGTTGVAVAEELVAGLSGAFVDSTVVIPDRAIVLGVSTRTVTAITGASSYDCGIAGEAAKFGGSLGVAAGSTNRGVIGPQAFYAPTPVRLTANGGVFTGGAVRLAIHYLTIGATD
ncbi:MAG: DUF2793 domain-containing protein [Armatimonadetes bacterium]|nr:DUF2793 domain-containing protein [Armatimonadota bacterium]